MNRAVNDSSPWRDDRWHGGRLRPLTGIIWLWWIMGALFGGMGSIPLFTERGLFEPTFEPLKLVLIFPLVALLMLARAFVMTIRHLRFSNARIEMRSMPGVIGGTVKGDLVLPFPLETGKLDIRLFLQLRETESRGGKSSNRVRYPFSRTLSVALEDIANGASVERIPFEFTVPYGLPDERKSEPKKHYRWQVAVEGNLPGRDMALLFDVPVYETEESDPAITEPEERLMIRRFQEKETTPETLRYILLESLGASTIFRTPVCLYFGKMMILSIVAFLFLLPVGFLGYMVWGTIEKGVTFDGLFDLVPILILGVQLLFILVFGLICLLLILVVLSEFIVRRTTVEGDDFVVYWRFLFYRKTIRKKVQDFTAISLHEQGSSTGEAGKKTVYYDVKAMKEGTIALLLTLVAIKKVEDFPFLMGRTLIESCPCLLNRHLPTLKTATSKTSALP